MRPVTAATFPGVRLTAARRWHRRYTCASTAATLAVAATGGIALERVRIAALDVSERFAGAPRIIGLKRGVTLEVPDPDGGVRPRARGGRGRGHAGATHAAAMAR